MNGDGVLLKNKKPDPDFPPAGEHGHIDQGAHERMGSFRNGASVGLFRHEDESFHPYFNEFVAIYPGRYRLTTSLWSFQWDKGKVLPARGTEAARLSIVQLTGDGRGGGHPSTVLGYYDAPSMDEQKHEVVTWLNPRETIGFNTASLAPAANYCKQGAGDGLHRPGHRLRLPRRRGPAARRPGRRSATGGCSATCRSREFDAEGPPRRPRRRRGRPDRQQLFMGKNKPDPVPGIWTVAQRQAAGRRRPAARGLPAAGVPPAGRRPRCASSTSTGSPSG